MLWAPESHERLDGPPWDAAAARAGIAAILAEAEAAFDPVTTSWPEHPDDELPHDAGPWTTVYLGAAGVVWALDRLGSQRDWVTVARELPERYRDAPDPRGLHPSLLCGESGVLLVEELVAGDTDRDRLAEVVAANADAEERELMWGAPGTMLVARVLHERTGEPRWLELWQASADALEGAWGEDGPWRQRLSGRDGHIIGPVHGFAGNVFALAEHGRGRFSLWTGDVGTAVYVQACLDADARVPFYDLF